MSLQLSPSRPPRAVLNRLRNMRRLDVLAAGQVCNRPCQLQHPKIGSRAEVHLLHSGFEQALARRVYLAESSYLGWLHIGVAGQRGVLKARSLPLSRGFHSSAYRLGGSPSRSLFSFS
jgi:hypothetical protein